MKKKYEFTDEMISFLVGNCDMNRKDLSMVFNAKFKTDYPQERIRQELYKHTNDRLSKKHEYTQEQEDFIKENANILSRKSLLYMFNQKFKTKLTYSAITQKIYNLGLDKKIEHITDEQRDFLISNFKGMDWKSLCDLFNRKYETHFSTKSLNRVVYENGYKKYKRNHFTEEQRIFLIENIEKYSYPRLTKEFNKKFNSDCTQGSITQQCLTYLKIKKADSYIPHNAVNIGEETLKYKTTKYKTTYIKVEKGPKNNQSEMWKPKHRIIWEEYNRAIAKDEVVIFLDGDKTNFELDNLYCISKKIMCVMNLNSWFTDSREHTLTAVKWCELYYKLKESEDK